MSTTYVGLFVSEKTAFQIPIINYTDWKEVVDKFKQPNEYIPLGFLWAKLFNRESGYEIKEGAYFAKGNNVS